MGDVAHHAQIVGDEQVGQVHLALEFAQHVHHLRLNGHVQRGDGLVAHDELRIQSQRPGDAHALPLSAGEFVGEAVRVILAQADHVQQLADALLLLGGACTDLVNLQALAHDFAHREEGIQGGVGILKDHLHPLGQLPGFLSADPADVLAVEDDPAAVGLVDA